jgi:hypothetical protein
MLHGMGIRTGTDLDGLVTTGDFICQKLGRANQSKVAVARLASMKQKEESELVLSAESSSPDEKARKAAASSLESAKLALCWPQLPTELTQSPPAAVQAAAAAPQQQLS